VTKSLAVETSLTQLTKSTTSIYHGTNLFER
jgi:hypothetical protein